MIAVTVIISGLAGDVERAAAAGAGGEQTSRGTDQHRPRLGERGSRRREGRAVAAVACAAPPHA